MTARTTIRGGLVAAVLAAAIAAGTLPATATAVDPPGWLAPVELMPGVSDPDAGTAAMGRGGDVVAAWKEGDELYAALKSPGSSFGPPIPLTPGSSGGDPQPAVDGDGGAVVAWESSNGTGAAPRVVRAAIRAKGTPGFAAAVDLSTPPPVDATFPDVAGNADGDVVVTWLESADGGTTYAIRAARRAPGEAFAPAVTVASGLGRPTPLPSAAIDAAGVATIVWSDGATIYAATSQPGGSFVQSVVSTGNEDLSPSIAVADDGATLVAWMRSAIGQPIASLGAWTAERAAGATTFDPPARRSPSGARAVGVRAGMTPGGDATVAWRAPGLPPFGQLVSLATRAAGGAWTPATVVSPADATVSEIVLAGGGTGTTFVGYSSIFGPFALQRPAGAAAFDSAVALAPAGVFSARMGLGADGAGNAVAAWADFGETKRVSVAGYDAAPPEIVSVAVPGAPVAGVPAEFTADARDVWTDTDVRWEFGDGDGGSGATVRHVYAAPGTYAVTLTASDAGGRTATRRIDVTVAPAPRPPTPQDPPGTRSPRIDPPPTKPRGDRTPPRPRVPAPRLTVTLGKTTIAGPGGRVRVGCRLSARALRSCRVTLIGPRTASVTPPGLGAGGSAALAGAVAGARGSAKPAAGQRRLGGGGATLPRAGRSAAVAVQLDARAREHVARALGGISATAVVVATMRDGRTLKATRRTLLLAARQRIVTPAGSFAPDGAAPTAAGRAFLRGIARALVGARNVRCEGFTAALSADADARYTERLGLARAQAACGALRRFSVRGRFETSSAGKERPIASNATESGRERNRRVELTVERGP